MTSQTRKLGELDSMKTSFGKILRKEKVRGKEIDQSINVKLMKMFGITSSQLRITYKEAPK